MITGVRRGETGAFRTIVYQDINPVAPGRVLTGPEPEKKDLEKMAAEQVADDGGHSHAGTPPQTFQPEIGQRQNEKKQIKRDPELSLAQIRKNQIKERIGPCLIDLCEEPMIKPE